MRSEEEISRTNLRVTMAAAFESGEILNASEETLQKYLASLCTERVPNEEVRHREIIRSLTINHIQMQRHVDKLNKQNNRLQWFVAILAIISLVTGAVQTYTTLKYSKDTPPHSVQQLRESQPPGGSNPSTYQPPIKDETKQKHK